MLIDSRTGLSDIADICTVHLPDVLVDCFTLSDQSIDGAAADRPQRRPAVPAAEHQDPAGPDADRRRREGEGSTPAGRWPGRGSIDFPRGHGRGGGERLLGRRWRSRTGRSTPSRRSLATFGDTPGSPTVAARRVRAAHRGDHRRAGSRRCRRWTRRRGCSTGTRSPGAGCRRPADIYLSYVTEDRMWADWIAAVLDQGGFRVRKQATTAPAGSNVKEEAGRAAASASRTVAVVSPSYLRSSQALGVREAMAVADPAGINRRLIPVHVGEARMPRPVRRPGGRGPDPARRPAGGRGNPAGARPAASARRP